MAAHGPVNFHFTPDGIRRHVTKALDHELARAIRMLKRLYLGAADRFHASKSAASDERILFRHGRRAPRWQKKMLLHTTFPTRGPVAPGEPPTPLPAAPGPPPKKRKDSNDTTDWWICREQVCGELRDDPAREIACGILEGCGTALERSLVRAAIEGGEDALVAALQGQQVRSSRPCA